MNSPLREVLKKLCCCFLKWVLNLKYVSFFKVPHFPNCKGKYRHSTIMLWSSDCVSWKESSEIDCPGLQLCQLNVSYKGDWVIFFFFINMNTHPLLLTFLKHKCLEWTYLKFGQPRIVIKQRIFQIVFGGPPKVCNSTYNYVVTELQLLHRCSIGLLSSGPFTGEKQELLLLMQHTHNSFLVKGSTELMFLW